MYQLLLDFHKHMIVVLAFSKEENYSIQKDLE